VAERSVEVKGVEEFLGKISRLYKALFDSSFMLRLATFIRASIETRTAQGIDADGKPFKPYSPSYAYFRHKTGHPIDRVNLFYTGAMMSSMVPDASFGEARVYFLNTRDSSGVPNPEKAFFLNQDRRFFAISKEEQDKVMKMVEEKVKEQMSGGK